MKHLCSTRSCKSKYLSIFAGATLLIFHHCLFAMSFDSRVAFYYRDHWPVDAFKAFNIVVVEPTDKSASQYNTESSHLYAYISIGETDPGSSYKSKVNRHWVIGKNPDWQSEIMDVSNPEWRSFLLKELIEPLWQQGYRGFFFDTLDSYYLTKQSPSAQQDGLVAFIKTVKSKHPDAKIILNRGFEVIPKVHENIEAVAAESLFSEWLPESKRYAPVSDKSRQWLQNTLQKIKNDFHLPIIVIDYLPPNEKKQARVIAKKIAQLGFIPWVTNGALDNIGIGTVEVLPRKVLILLDPSEKNELMNEEAYLPLIFPLQYMGYIPVEWVMDGSFPDDIKSDEYAGIVAWLNHPVTKHSKKFNDFLLKQTARNIPVVFFNYLGLHDNATFLTKFGINSAKAETTAKSVTHRYLADMFDYEISAKPNIINFFSLSVANAQPIVEVTSDTKHLQTAAALTPFGGFVLEPFVLAELPEGQNRWVVDPFRFLKKAMHLPDMPVPDITTSNGRRLSMIHVDGDAFISLVPWEKNSYAGDLMLNQIFKKYPLPITVSVIEREFEIIKANPGVYTHLVQVAKDMFALPWVEIATHTYSHPLEWEKLEEGKENKPYLSYPDERYMFSYEKEIAGSSSFINQNFAPKDKRVKVVLWSGDGMVTEKPLLVADQAKLMNLNGMSDLYLPTSKSLTNLSGFGRFVGNYYHVYSPISNDFIYNDDWTPPLYRFINVIDTFILTESPHRYKPISIYYHFYSAVDQGAFRALKNIYEWVVQQKTTPVHLTDYIQKVLAFNHLVIARTLNDGWLITNNAPLREFRVPIGMGTPLVSANDNVIGFNQANQDYYIHLGNKSETLLYFSRTPNTNTSKPYLKESNAEHASWRNADNNYYELELRGYSPLEFQLANIEGCAVSENGATLIPDQEGSFKLKEAISGKISIQCG